MANPTAQLYPVSRDGKPINIGDTVTILATVTASSSYGSSAALTVTLLGSGTTGVTVYANDVGAPTQTL